MAIAFRQYATGGAATATSVTCDKPTGTTDGDILVAKVYLEDADDAVTATGWTPIRTDIAAGTSPFQQKLYWKRAASEGASYTFSWATSVWSHAVILAYSGCLASGDVIDDQDGAVGLTVGGVPPNSYTAPSLTTTVAATMLVYSCETVMVSEANIVTDAAMTRRAGFDCGEFADEGRAATGDTGTRAAELQTGVDNIGMAMAMFALKPAGGLISASISPSVSPSASASVSPSVSESVSPSLSASVSPSLSTSVSPSLSPSSSPSATLWTGACWGEQTPDAEEEARPWTEWVPGGDVQGDGSWGRLEVTEGLSYTSPVVEMGDAGTKTITAQRDKYHTGGGGTGVVTIYVRGQADMFGRADVSPSWAEYTAPIEQAWRYIQWKLEYVSS